MKMLVKVLLCCVIAIVTLGEATQARECDYGFDLSSYPPPPTTRRGFIYLREAEMMAMEATGSLLPDVKLVNKIRLDMEAIRAQFPLVSDLYHRKKWAPGKLRFQNISESDVRRINSTEFGPVKVRYLSSRYRDAQTSLNITYLNFPKFYNPMVLSGKLEELLGIQSDPVTSIFRDGDDTVYNVPRNTYVFIRGTGKCFISCEQKHFWNFLVKCNKNREVVLMDEQTVHYKPTILSLLES